MKHYEYHYKTARIHIPPTTLLSMQWRHGHACTHELQTGQSADDYYWLTCCDYSVFAVHPLMNDYWNEYLDVCKDCNRTVDLYYYTHWIGLTADQYWDIVCSWNWSGHQSAVDDLRSGAHTYYSMIRSRCFPHISIDQYCDMIQEAAVK